jgi:hypothetical protein
LVVSDILQLLSSGQSLFKIVCFISCCGHAWFERAALCKGGRCAVGR